MKNSPYKDPQYLRKLLKILTLQEFLDKQMSEQFFIDTDVLGQTKKSPFSREDKVKILKSLNIKNKRTLSLVSFNLESADKEYWNRRIAFRKTYPKFNENLLDDIRFADLPPKHIRVLENDYSQFWYNEKVYNLTEPQATFIKIVHQKYLLSNENEFEPLDVFTDYRDTKEDTSKWKLSQVFQKTNIIGNLIKIKRNNLYFLDLDF